jgi:hypothetical protein
LRPAPVSMEPVNMDDLPFDWWHSGRYWYCSLPGPPGYKVSGCGTTKEEAIKDAQRDRLKLVGRLRLRAAHSAGEKP